MQPLLSRNLWLVPLFGERPHEPVVPLHEALCAGRAEVLETHHMERLIVHNHSEQPLLGLGGMELLGGFQNRILSQSCKLEQGERRTLDTRCVEAGRWGRDVSDFRAGGLAYPSLRSSVASGRS